MQNATNYPQVNMVPVAQYQNVITGVPHGHYYNPRPPIRPNYI